MKHSRDVVWSLVMDVGTTHSGYGNRHGARCRSAATQVCQRIMRENRGDARERRIGWSVDRTQAWTGGEKREHTLGIACCLWFPAEDAEDNVDLAQAFHRHSHVFSSPVRVLLITTFPTSIHVATSVLGRPHKHVPVPGCAIATRRRCRCWRDGASVASRSSRRARYDVSVGHIPNSSTSVVRAARLPLRATNSVAQPSP